MNFFSFIWLKLCKLFDVLPKSHKCSWHKAVRYEFSYVLLTNINHFEGSTFLHVTLFGTSSIVHFRVVYCVNLSKH